jgi:hypothetical protein
MLCCSVAALSPGAASAQPTSTVPGDPSEVPSVHVEGPVRTEPKSDPVARWLSIITAGVAVFGVPFVVAQLRGTRRAGRDQLTARFAERYDAREFQSVASRALSFLRVVDATECVTKLEAFHRRQHADHACLPRARDRPLGPMASVNDLFEVLGFFESLGAAYNRKELTRRKLHETIPAPPVQFFTEGWWWICWDRGGGWVGRKPWRRIPPRFLTAPQTDLHIQWEWMVKALKRSVVSVADMDATTSRLVLCLPPSADRTRSVPWSRARRLSKLFSDYGEACETS